MSNIEETLIERGETHGDWEIQSSTAQELKHAAKGGSNYCDLTDSQTEALDLILTKISRIVCGNSNEPDHWKDIQGYAKLAEKSIKHNDF